MVLGTSLIEDLSPQKDFIAISYSRQSHATFKHPPSAYTQNIY